MSFYFEPETLEVNGIPFELVKPSVFHLSNKMQMPVVDLCHSKSDVAPQMDFVLQLIRSVMHDKKYIEKNCSVLTWYLPAQFLRLQADDGKAQRRLWKDLVCIHDFVRCFSIYLNSCRSNLKRSEDSTSKKLDNIINRDELPKEIKLLVEVGGMEFWRFYQKESKCKREKFPSIPDALARVVANSDKLYPVLPAVYALYVLKKMGHSPQISKDALLTYDGTIGTPDYHRSTALLFQAKYMAGIIQQQFYAKIRVHLSFFRYKYKKPYNAALCHFIFSPLESFDDWEDETPKEQDHKENFLRQSDTIHLPICNVRRLALDLGERYGLSTKEIGELHRKLPGYLYSTTPSKYELSFSVGLKEKLGPILKGFRKICDPSYYSLSGSFNAVEEEKKKEIQKLVPALASSERKVWSKGGNNDKASLEDMGKFIKRYLKFWDPVLLTLFCCAPVPMELSSESGIIPYTGDIRKSLLDTMKEEFEKCLECRKISCTFSGSTSVMSLINLSKRVLTLKDAVDLLQQLLDQKEALKATLDRFFNKQDQSLIDLWQCCAVSDENISYVYTRLLAYAQKLVGRAAMGIYYRAVFLKYGMTPD